MQYTAPDSAVSVCVAQKFRSNCIPPKHDSYVPHYSEKIGHIQDGRARIIPDLTIRTLHAAAPERFHFCGAQEGIH
jgi:hypothetical protein